ncbi:hypothetical protein HNQ07_003892 [Deinococcus metalli]|uniref:Uncharacterized protein n=1 Tax=Deinococcus metalli TaxID=1141878 RepID=A0A7W8KHQ5_9DEIO|nr:hypothetical protein [Deinococcus metalli]MBB5378386.1 hypothetical protein [Deinococcus metalli]GHF59296.1 hypothetical protein GCM10017781_39450 [Deinococcus metalli]
MTGGAPSGLNRIPLQMLGDLVSPRALERILQDASEARGLSWADLDAPTLEDILKKEVFKRLQLTIPAPLAKKRVSDVLNELMKTTQERGAAAPAVSSLQGVEEGARKFALYFDWPETQRLRSLLVVARQEEHQGRDVTALVQEGQDLVAQLERRLQESLVAQAQDLAEMRAAFARVQGMGSREVRRLETLIGQIDEAQSQGTLLPAEVERARNLTFSLRKLLESSVVQTVGSGAPPPELDPDAQARVLALEQEHAAQQLAALQRDFAPLLDARPDLQARQSQLVDGQRGGHVTTAEVGEWRGQLLLARDEVLTEQRAAFANLEAQLQPHTESGDLAMGVRVLLDTARQTLALGNLATDALRELHDMSETLGDGHVDGSRLATQQELLDLERSVRALPAAMAELEPLLAQARARFAQGDDPELAPLWTLLERHMGAAAQERDAFDARADVVIDEYAPLRHLAGETTQKLGRLADSLRAQRRLGSMSAPALARYGQSLLEAEALLAEAKAEFRAAQEVTSTFGEDALSGLLDVFDLGGDASADPAPPATPPAPPAPPAPASVHDLLAGLGTFGAPAPAALPADAWTVRDGRVTGGATDPAATGVAALLTQADALGLNRLDMADALSVWSARRSGSGWRVGRAESWDALDQRTGAWLDGA